jgi:hypothetical protein
MVCNRSQKYDGRYEIGQMASLERVGSRLNGRSAIFCDAWIWAVSFHKSESIISEGKDLEQDPGGMNSQYCAGQ